MREYVIPSLTSPIRLGRWPSLVLIPFLSLCAVPCTIAQSSRDSAYETTRHKAAELFDQGKRLEALPFLEELTQTKTKNIEMLVASAACVIEHAAVVTDQQAQWKNHVCSRPH